MDVLRKFVHLNETAIHKVKNLGMTEKGKKSEFLLVIGEKSETTHSLHIVTTPIEYWLLTTFPREKWYRQYWMALHNGLPAAEAYESLAAKFPHGLSSLDELPEERSGEVMNVALGRPPALMNAVSVAPHRLAAELQEVSR